MIVYHYPSCSTCKKALTWLDAHHISYEAKHIVDAAPAPEELSAWADISGLPLKRFFNTSGKRYRELGVSQTIKNGVSDEELIDLLASDGMLIKRPLVIHDGGVLVGFKESEWEEALLHA